MKHCCLKMEGALEEHDSPLRYVPYIRKYYIEFDSAFQNEDTGEDAVVVADTLHYCPWCGTKLPKGLKDEWTKIVKKEFKVKSTLDKEELKKVPEEYMTEEWWKKGGL